VRKCKWEPTLTGKEEARQTNWRSFLLSVKSQINTTIQPNCVKNVISRSGKSFVAPGLRGGVFSRCEDSPGPTQST